MRGAVVVLALVLAGCSAPDSSPVPSATTAPSPSVSSPVARPARSCAVVKVTDGDTVHVACHGQRVKIRVIGLDTPETVDPRKPVQCYGPEASAKAKQLLPHGRVVRVSADATQSTTDIYERTLAYVTLANGTDYGGYMIGHGFGREYTFRKPYLRQEMYRTAQKRAKDAGLGLWGACQYAG